MSFTNYLEAELLDHVFGNAAYSAPTTLYLGLCTGVSEAGVITGEPSSGNYSRVTITNNSTNFPAANGGSKASGAVFTFPEANGSWGTLTMWFLSDASSGNTNTLIYGDLTQSKTVSAGDTPKFNSGELTITLD